MAKSYVVGFESVELVDGLAPDTAVWLYMRATLYDDGKTDHPLWMDEVGSLPSDANPPGFDGFPSGDAGRYADGLKVGQPVTNSSDTNLPNFSVGPVAVGPGQTLEVLVIMLPKVWLETISVPPETADRAGYGALGIVIGSGGGPLGAVTGLAGGLFAGLFGSSSHNVDVPCFNAVIMARNVFTSADLDRIESAGIERLGPQDNESYVVCHQQIDAFYSLSVNPRGFGFAPTPQPHQELCTLEPRAYLPAEDQLQPDWGDVGDRISDCIQVMIRAQSPRHFDVTIYHRGGAHRTVAGYRVLAQFNQVPLTRGVPHPDFRRNFYDDGCPARAVKPGCPDCARFVNLPMEMVVHPGLLLLGMLPGSHVGSRPVFPIKVDTDRVSAPRRTCRECTNATQMVRSQHRPVDVAVPAQLGDRHMIQAVDETHVRIWPTGTTPVRDQTFGARSLGALIDQEAFLPPELPLAWLLVCSPEITLATYQEIKADGGCRARLRYTRRDAHGTIVADAMLTRFPEAVR